LLLAHIIVFFTYIYLTPEVFMAKLSGGVFGVVTGKTGGIVFSTARGSAGKVNTARAFVKPSNPNTADQQSQRNFFTACIDIVRRIGSSVYQDDWNRGVGQNPGYQSLVSTILSARASGTDFDAPAEVNLGTLYAPGTIAAATGSGAGEIDVTWSTENGDNGEATDYVVIFAYATDKTKSSSVARSVKVAARSNGAVGVTLTGLDAGEPHVVGIYLVGNIGNAGLVSPCQFDTASAHA
jgi:hypothetical protein